MPRETTQIMDGLQMGQKIMRIAYEIYENNYQEKDIVLIGITGNGNELAHRIEKTLGEISGLNLVRYEITLNKDKPLESDIKFTGELKALKGKSIILIDDVLNSGRTLIYATRFILDAAPKSLSTATLVDRFHRKFPIRADYVGLTLSTNLKEHVRVELGKGKEAVYLE
jgi:pyrimidine operon attenuation protein / uracil phosphoribosyltransferase